jgi:hypothetical protein
MSEVAVGNVDLENYKTNPPFRLTEALPWR